MENAVPESPASSPSTVKLVFYNERGLRAGWRLIIFICILAVLVFGVLFPLSRILRAPQNPTELIPGNQIIGEGITFFLVLFATGIMSRIEKRPMGVYGLPLKQQPVFARVVNGYIFWGFLALSVCLLTLRLIGVFDFGGPALRGAEIWLYGLKWLIAFILVGLSEEYLLRGYALYTLADGIGFWPATIVLGVLFGLGHASNPGETRIGVFATVVFAVFASLTLRLTGNLWLAVGAHAGWDWGQSFFYGVSDSGISAKGHFLNPTFHGPVWLTGGSVGPEGSVVTLVLWTAMMLLFYLRYRNRRADLPITEPGPVAPSSAL